MIEQGLIEVEDLKDTDVLDLAEVETFMSRVFNPNHSGARGRPSPAVVKPQVEVQPLMDCDEVGALVAKASRAIEILATRCEIMEQELAEAASRVAEHEQTANRWKSIALELRSKAAADQAVIDKLQARNEEAEAQVASLEALTIEIRERVAAADARSSRLHNQVVAAFNSKSSVHSIIQAVNLREAAE